MDMVENQCLVAIGGHVGSFVFGSDLAMVIAVDGGEASSGACPFLECLRARLAQFYLVVVCSLLHTASNTLSALYAEGSGVRCFAFDAALAAMVTLVFDDFGVTTIALLAGHLGCCDSFKKWLERTFLSFQ